MLTRQHLQPLRRPFVSGGRFVHRALLAKNLAAFCLFFQAEDGIRDRTVTGVQTCALPIFDGTMFAASLGGLTRSSDRGCTWARSEGTSAVSISDFFVDPNDSTFVLAIASGPKIGRASCRERV